MQIIPTLVLVGGSNKMEPVGTTASILTQGPWRHSVEHSLGRDRDGAGSQGKPWQQGEREFHTSGNRERDTGTLWVGSDAGSEGRDQGRELTYLEHLTVPGTELDSLSIVPHLIFATSSKYYWPHFYTFRK